MRAIAPLSLITAATLYTAAASAGVIADENTGPGDATWPVTTDGTANGSQTVDLYPAHWSIARGEKIRLKVRALDSYTMTIYRLGWYGGAGARQIYQSVSNPAVVQSYPSADPVYGAADAGWADTATIPTDSSWVPGLYVARVDLPSGDQGATFFVVRDDGPAPMPVLMVVATNTHEAYN